MKKLKVEISKTTKYKDEYSKLVQREKHLKDTIIGNGSNVLFPISMSLKQKEEYLKNNYETVYLQNGHICNFRNINL